MVTIQYLCNLIDTVKIVSDIIQELLFYVKGGFFPFILNLSKDEREKIEPYNNI